MNKGGKQPICFCAIQSALTNILQIKEQKLLIVLHGEFRKNLSAIEDNEREELDDKQSGLISGLCWEVFNVAEKSSLTGVQIISEEELSTLRDLQNYVKSLDGFSLGFVTTDDKILNILKEAGVNWSESFEFWNILSLAKEAFGVEKQDVNELISYLNLESYLQSDQPQIKEVASRISKVIALIFEKNINTFTSSENGNESGQKDADEKEGGQRLQMIIGESNENLPAQESNKSEWNSQTQEKPLDEEEIWGENSREAKLKKNFDQKEDSEKSVQAPKKAQIQQHQAGESDQKERSRSRSFDRKEKPQYEEQSNSSASQLMPFHSQQYKREEGQDESENSDGTFHLRLRGLPFNARERELFDFLGFTLEPDQVYFRYDPMGRFLGECVIQSPDQKQQDRIQSMHMKNMGKRYIEVFSASRGDFIRAQESQSIEEDRGSSDPQQGSSYDSDFLKSIGIVKVRGLPYESSDQDIQGFFRESSIIPNGIQKVFEGRRPSGEAFILFATKADANKALEKDKQRMGSRYIEIFLCHPKEYTNHIKNRKQFQSGYSQGGYGHNAYNQGSYQGYGQGGYGHNDYSQQRFGGQYNNRYEKYGGYDQGRYTENRFNGGGYPNRHDVNGSPGRTNGGPGFYRKPYDRRYDNDQRYNDDKHNKNNYNSYNKYDSNRSRYRREEYNQVGYQGYDNNQGQYGSQYPQAGYQQPEGVQPPAIDPTQQQQSQPYYYNQYQYQGQQSGQQQTYPPAAVGQFQGDQQVQQQQQYPYPQYPQYPQQYYQQGTQAQVDPYQQLYGQQSASTSQPGTVTSQYYPASQSYEPGTQAVQHGGRQAY